MTTRNPKDIKVILATDCGSTTTKAILIEQIEDGTYRQTFRGEAPTTVENPFADVTVGVTNSVTEIGELAGRKLFDARWVKWYLFRNQVCHHHNAW